MTSWRTKNLGPRAVRGFRERPLAERFWSKVDRSGGPDSCWLWLRPHRVSIGYGVFMVSKTPKVITTAHRVAYELTHGSVPKDRYVCHRCDNPACVNPAHLFLGTAMENMRDAKRKGRTRAGSRHPFSKLTEAQVTEMRRLRATEHWKLKELSRRFGVAESAVSRICNRVRRTS